MEQELEDYYTYLISSNKASGTLIQYRNILEKFMEFCNNSKVTKWSEVNTTVLANYKKILHDIYSEATQIQHQACIRAFFKYLGLFKNIENKSAIIVFDNLSMEGLTTQDYLSSTELNIIWETCKDNPLELAIVSMLFSTGLRHSEIISLDDGNVDFEEMTVRVFGKGKSWRTVLLTKKCKGDLTRYLSTRVRISENKSDRDAFFLSPKGKRLNYNQLSYIFEKLKNKISRIHPHLLRHTFATYLLSTGSTIKEVQDQLGHKRLSTTGRYVHVTEDEKIRHERLSKYEGRHDI